MFKTNKQVIKILQLIFILITVVLLLGFIYSNWQEFIKYNWSPNMFYLGLSFVFYMLNHLIMAVRWKQLLIVTGENISFKESFKINSISAVARYLPGGFWDQLGKYTLSKRYGLSNKNIFLSLWFDIVMTIFSGVIIFLISLLFLENVRQELVFLSVIVIILGFAGIYPPFLQKILDFALQFLKKGKVNIDFTYLATLKILLWYLLYWILFGSSFFVLIYAFGSISFKLIPAIIGLYSISWVVGFLTPIAPNGLGIREATLTLLLKPLLPLPILIVSIIGFRLLIIFVDLLSAGISSKLQIKKHGSQINFDNK